MENSQEFIHEWEKINNPLYPNEMSWDKIKIIKMLADFESQKKEIIKIRKLLIESQDDLIRMMRNAQIQQEAERIIGNEYAEKFHSGNVMAFEYACKHITNILEKTE